MQDFGYVSSSAKLKPLPPKYVRLNCMCSIGHFGFRVVLKIDTYFRSSDDASSMKYSFKSINEKSM